MPSFRFLLTAMLLIAIGRPTSAAEPTKEQMDAVRAALEKVDGYMYTSAYFFELAPHAKLGLRRKVPKITEEFVKSLPEVPFPHGLIISDNEFIGEGLKLLKGRKNLMALYISDTSLTDDGVRELAEIDTLEHVYLWYSPKLTNTALQSLAKMKSLKALNVGGSKINDEGMKVLGQMTNLEQLWVSHLSLTDVGLKPLENLTGLKAICLMENRKLTANAVATFLRKVKSLERLDLEFVECNDAVLKEIGRHTKMQHLSLYDIVKVTDDGVKELAGLTDMTYLSLVGSQLSDNGLKHLLGMSKLERLHVYGTELTEKAVPDLVKFKQLNYIWLNRGISKDVVAKAMPKCILQ